MSYDSGFDSDQVENHNFEMNSTVSVTMMPNHGYTSGYTDLNRRNYKNNDKRRILLDTEREPIEENKNSKGSKSSTKPSPRITIDNSFLSPQEDQSDSSSNYNQPRRRVINRKTRTQDADMLSQSSKSELKSNRSGSKPYDLLNPRLTRQFYHPHVQEVSFSSRVRNITFE